MAELREAQELPVDKECTMEIIDEQKLTTLYDYASACLLAMSHI
jgi:hypothetical protein